MSSSTNIWEISTNNNGNGTDNNQFYISDTSDPVKKLTIQRGTGIVGVGTNTPISIADENVKLDVNGSLNLSGNIYKNGVLYVSNSTTWIENGEKIYYSSGNVGINTTNPLELLEVNGTIKATNIIADGSGVIFLNASSIDSGKLDNNILPATISTSYFKGSGAGITNINPAAFSFGSINNIHMPDNITGKTYIGTGSDITNLNATNIYIGTLHNDRMPANISVATLAGNGSGITNLNPLSFSGNITNSQLPADISVTSFSGIGSGITNLNATYITFGKLNTAQLPDTISGKTFSGDGFNITNLNANNISSSGVLSNSIIPDNLSISGTFTAANLLVNGTSTIIDTITYQTSKLNITNTYNTDPSLIIEHNSQYNVININDNNTRRVTISNGGNVGIGGTTFPNSIYKLDVDGGINSSGNISSQKVLIRDTLEFYKDSTHSVLIKLPQTISNYTITLPNAGPAANNILKSDSSGNLSWVNINESPTLENVYTFFDGDYFEKTTNITLKNINSSKLISAFNSTQFELFGDPQIIRIKDNLITAGNVSLTSFVPPPSNSISTLNIVYNVDKYITTSTTQNVVPVGYLKFDGSDWFIDEINSNDYLSRNSLYNELSISRYLSNNNYSIIITYQYSVDNIVWYDIDKGDDIYIAKSEYTGTYPEYKNNFVGNTLFIKVKSCSLNSIYNKNFNISSASPYTTHTHTITYSISSVSITPTPSISYTGNELSFPINLNTINFPVNTKKILTINLSTNYDALTGGTGSTRQQTDKFYLFYEEF